MAQRVNWRGKTATMLTVGKSNWTDYRTIGSALDSITDAAHDNRYVVMLAYDRTTEQVDWNKSHVDLAGESRWWSIIERPKDDVTGGTIQAATDAASGFVEDFGFYGVRVVRDQSGDTLEGEPPEAGLFIGQESTHPNRLHWDNCTVTDCVIEGVHDGLQIHGQRFDYTGAPSRIVSIGNQIRCAHDALTYKGLVRATHVHEDIEVRSQGFDPYITDVAAWKHTGLHVNFSFPQASPTTSCPQTAWVELTACRIAVEDGTNTATSGAQSVVAGVYLYDENGTFSPTGFDWSYPVRLDGCAISVVSNTSTAIARGVAGVLLWQESQRGQVPSNGVTLSSCSIHVEQQHASGPAGVAGVWSSGGDTATATTELRAVGCSITGSNANGTAYSLQADTQSDTIIAKVYSDLSTNIDAAATLTAATARP